MVKVPELLDRLAPWPPTDFSEWGEIEVKPLTRYQKLTGQFLGRNWVSIPHVTHHDEVDVTNAEIVRRAWNDAHPERKITPIAMIAKALVSVLRQFPSFNSSLDESGGSLVLKRYFNIGIAVDTPSGLLVPVIHGCDDISAAEIAERLAALAEKARAKGLSMAEMAGSSITVSSLGHIGGTGFTPIINAPDVAIVGLTKLAERAVRTTYSELEWRRFLPVSLSYDHRVINGADAARFVVALGKALNEDDLL